MSGGLSAADLPRLLDFRGSARDEARLLRRVAEKDVRAFEALYRIYHPRLTRFVVHLIRRPALAEEVLDETMLAVWARPEGYDGSCKVSTWIFAIAYRKALNAIRRDNPPVEDPRSAERASDEPGPEQRLGDRQVGAVLASAMAGLSPDHRAVVDLTYFHEMGYREISEIMDCPVDTVKTRMFHARRHLRRALPGALSDWL
jgi:RNA polymerase sigma-70 factor (ECF subfamily)